SRAQSFVLAFFPPPKFRRPIRNAQRSASPFHTCPGAASLASDRRVELPAEQRVLPRPPPSNKVNRRNALCAAPEAHRDFAAADFPRDHPVVRGAEQLLFPAFPAI